MSPEVATGSLHPLIWPVAKQAVDSLRGHLVGHSETGSLFALCFVVVKGGDHILFRTSLSTPPRRRMYLRPVVDSFPSQRIPALAYVHICEAPAWKINTALYATSSLYTIITSQEQFFFETPVNSSSSYQYQSSYGLVQ